MTDEYNGRFSDISGSRRIKTLHRNTHPPGHHRCRVRSGFGESARDPAAVGSLGRELRGGGRRRSAAEFGGITEIPEQGTTPNHRDQDDERE